MKHLKALQAWLYVEPDGDVLPSQGLYQQILGNILQTPGKKFETGKVQDFRNLDRQEWHRRYLEQVRWTAHLRQYIFDKSHSIDNYPWGRQVPAILQSLLDEGYHNTIGIDLDCSSVVF